MGLEGNIINQFGICFMARLCQLHKMDGEPLLFCFSVKCLCQEYVLPGTEIWAAG